MWTCLHQRLLYLCVHRRQRVIQQHHISSSVASARQRHPLTLPTCMHGTSLIEYLHPLRPEKVLHGHQNHHNAKNQNQCSELWRLHTREGYPLFTYFCGATLGHGCHVSIQGTCRQNLRVALSIVWGAHQNVAAHARVLDPRLLYAHMLFFVFKLPALFTLPELESSQSCKAHDSYDMTSYSAPPYFQSSTGNGLSGDVV